MEHWNIQLGRYGERIAKNYLIKNGYIVYENVRYGTKQIDLIACKKGVMRIIEVKTISKTSAYSPEDRLSMQKKRHLKELYYIFNLILAKNEDYLHVDFIAINYESNKMANIKHYFDIYS